MTTSRGGGQQIRRPGRRSRRKTADPWPGVGDGTALNRTVSETNKGRMKETEERRSSVVCEDRSAPALSVRRRYGNTSESPGGVRSARRRRQPCQKRQPCSDQAADGRRREGEQAADKVARGQETKVAYDDDVFFFPSFAWSLTLIGTYHEPHMNGTLHSNFPLVE